MAWGRRRAFDTRYHLMHVVAYRVERVKNREVNKEEKEEVEL